MISKQELHSELHLHFKLYALHFLHHKFRLHLVLECKVFYDMCSEGHVFMAGSCRSVLSMRKPQICSDLDDNKEAFNWENVTLQLGFESASASSLFF